MNIEIALDAIDQDGSLLVGAAPRAAGTQQAGTPEDTPGRGNLTVRMTFTAAGQPEGTKLIIDGFSRALRAQIPN
jgi:hypothetical protein